MTRRRLDLRPLGAALAVAMALQLWFMVDSSLNRLSLQWAVVTDPSKALVHLSLAVCVLLAVRWADRQMDQGVSPWRAHALAVGLGVASGSVLQYLLHRVLQVADNPYGTAPTELVPSQMLRVGLEYVLWAALIVGVHVTLRQHRQAEARMHEARMTRERARCREIESRLQALQARVEPRLLLDALDQVRRVHAGDAERAAAMLDALVDYLRAALPQLRETGSTWRRELERVRAWLALKGQGIVDVTAARGQDPGQALAGHVDFLAELSAEWLDDVLPPVLLLPAVQLVLTGASTGTLRLAGHAGPHGAQVDILFDGCAAGPWQPDRQRIEELRSRLSMHYGVAGRFEVDGGPGRRRAATMHLPGHR